MENFIFCAVVPNQKMKNVGPKLEILEYFFKDFFYFHNLHMFIKYLNIAFL